MLQRAFDGTSQCLFVCATIIATQSLLKMDLALVFRLNHRYNLWAGLYQFLLGEHTSAAWKVLKAHVDQHQVIAGGGGAPTLADTSYLTAPYGFTLTDMADMVRSSHARMWVVLDTLLGRDHPVAQGMEVVFLELIEW